MTHRRTVQLLLHGVLLVVIGMVAGFIYRFAIADDWGPDQERTWRIIHTFVVQIGILDIAVAAAARHLTLSERAGTFVVWALAGSAYMVALGLVFAPFADTRGLDGGDSVVSLLIFANFGLFSAIGLAGMVVVLRAVLPALRAARE